MDIKGEKFDKSERLCSTKAISALFETGNQFHTSHFKIVWDFNQSGISAPAQVMFSVPKRGFRHAVTRNLIKRRLREAYRRKKKVLYEDLTINNIQIALVIIMKGNSVPDYTTVEKSVKEILGKLMVKIKEKLPEHNPSQVE
jgi:ribonuclease P protein component